MSTQVNSYSQIKNLPYVQSNAYNFVAQSPGGTLGSNTSNTITLSPVPQGVNGTNTNHYLYISGGTGTAEAVLITGGSAVSGAVSGTITFTPTSNHSGAWTIQSATAGIQETANVNPNYFVSLPGGHIDIYATITLPGNHPGIVGQGEGGCLLLVHFTSANIINVTSGDATFNDFFIAPQSGNMTTGACIYANSNSNLYLNRMQLGAGGGNNCSIGVHAFGGELHIKDVEIVAQYRGVEIFSGAPYISGLHVVSDANTSNYLANGAGIYMHNTSGGFISDYIHDAGIFDYGMYLDLSGNSFSSEFCITGLYIDNWVTAAIISTGATSSTPHSFKVNLTNFTIVDNGMETGQGIVLNPGCQGWRISNGGVEFTEAAFRLTGAAYVSINAVQMTPNVASVGNSICVHIASPSPLSAGHNIKITGCDMGLGLDGNTPLRGILCEDTGLDSLIVVGNRLQGSTAPVTLTGSETNVYIANNPPYNPVGMSSISPSGSPFTYTAGTSPEVVYIFGGTVTNIKRGSTQIASASPAQVTLPPGGTLQVTYSGAPTMVKDIQ